MPDIYARHRKQSIQLDESSQLSVFLSALPANTDVFAEHHHTAFELTMILAGSGVYATKNNEYSFQEGDIFFFSTDEIHWIQKLDSDAEFINIHFEPRFIWSENFGFSNKELIRLFFSHKKIELNRIAKGTAAADSISALIFKIEREMTERKSAYAAMVKACLVSILVEMVRAYDGQLSRAEFSYSAESLKYMEAALEYVDEHLEDDLTLEKLAAVAHMSKTYFCGQFRKLNGISPWEYITIKRIERAIHLIETTNLSRLDVAMQCGFNNTSNFYHAFKKVTGKMPTDYKKIASDYLEKTNDRETMR